MGINISSDLTPKNEEGFAVAQGKHLKDVMLLVDNNTDRDTLPSPVKVEGVIVYSKAEDKFYIYESSVWVEKTLGATPSNGLKTLANGNIGLGGALTESSTIINAGGNSLFIDGFAGLNFFSQGFTSTLSLTGGTSILTGDNLTIRGGPFGSTSDITISTNSVVFLGKPLRFSNDEVNIQPSGDLTFLPGAGDGRPAIYGVIPTTLVDESIPAWKNVTDAIIGTNLTLGPISATNLDVNSSTGDNVTLPPAAATFAGLMSATDKSKLDNIEPNATADQTASEIKVSYESNANTNEFSDSEKSKLAGLESSRFKGTYVSKSALDTAHPTSEEGSYADVDGGVGQEVNRYIWDNDDSSWILQLGESAALTDVQIKTQYENNADTNGFTDSEKTKLSNQSNTNTGDETAGTIKTKYESNANTNAFTDAEKANLANQSNTNTGDETTLSIQTKRAVKTVNGVSLEGIGDIVTPLFDADTEGVLTKYVSTQVDVSQTTNSTTGVTYLTLVAPAVIGEKYLAILSFTSSHSAANNRAFVDIKDFGVSVLPTRYEMEPKDTDNRAWTTRVAEIIPNPLGGGQFQLQLDFGSTNGGATTTMYAATLSLIKLPV